MIKFILFLSMLNLNFSSSYVGVKSITHYQNNERKKEIIFEFESDYYSTHKLDVKIDL